MCTPRMDTSASWADNNSVDEDGEETEVCGEEVSSEALGEGEIKEFLRWIRFGRCILLSLIVLAITFSATELHYEAVAMVSVLAIAFACYDLFVQNRMTIIFQRSVRTNAIVSSMFPATFHDRLPVPGQCPHTASATTNISTIRLLSRKTSAKSLRCCDGANEFESKKTSDNVVDYSKPIADMYPETTIMLLDLVGFTAWSSAREPSAVFLLLESVFAAFDEIAKKRHVFKVETVGDCYVAVTGLPEPRKDHAMAMARFANDCLNKFAMVTRQLERKLGPDTSSLGVRIGLHSGPITGGVLRGDRARFQLFGDTINTASRMESNGKRDHIQLSDCTAQLIMGAGKGHWLKKREDLVEAKGKGYMQCYWLNICASSRTLNENGSSGEGCDEEIADESLSDEALYAHERHLSNKHSRLVDWNTECLFQLLKQIALSRDGFNQDDPAFLNIMGTVKEQLKAFVRCIALKYNHVPFHNFEHASHVVMSVIKLLGRIVDPNNFDSESEKHLRTYGIDNNLSLNFALIFAALIHDVDHRGVSNVQLIKEMDVIAHKYDDKSVAGEHSFEIAWELLMQSDFVELRRTLFTNDQEMQRFQQSVHQAVMATDIADKELESARRVQWEEAFQSDQQGEYNTLEAKANAAMDYIIQASDVAHTMQHWHIYCKWTERIMKEKYLSWKEGRGDTESFQTWYQSELVFFDQYVIPLATRLQECGVFGAAGAQYLDYARDNRKELQEKGEELFLEIHERCQTKYGTTQKVISENVPEPSKLFFSTSESSSVMGEAGVPPDLSFRISEQFGPGPGGLFMTKEWSMPDIVAVSKPHRGKVMLPTPYH